MLWLAKFFTKGKSLKDAIKYFHTINGRMPNNLETIKIKNAFMDQTRKSNVIDITSRIKDEWWKKRPGLSAQETKKYEDITKKMWKGRQHPEVTKKVDEDTYSALLERHGKELEGIDTKQGMGFYREMGDIMKKHRREELEFQYDEMFNKILEKAKRIDRDPKVLLEAELGKKLTGEETTTQLLDLFKNRPKKASGGRIGYGGGKLVGEGIIRFLQKVFGKAHLDDIRRTDPQLYSEMIKTVPLFRSRDKKAMVEYFQKHLPHKSLKEAEEFLIGEGDMAGVLLRLSNIKDYQQKIKMMEQLRKANVLKEFDVTGKKPHAAGGIAGQLHLYDGGRASFGKGKLAKGFFEFVEGLFIKASNDIRLGRGLFKGLNEKQRIVQHNNMTKMVEQWQKTKTLPEGAEQYFGVDAKKAFAGATKKVKKDRVATTDELDDYIEILDPTGEAGIVEEGMTIRQLDDMVTEHKTYMDDMYQQYKRGDLDKYVKPEVLEEQALRRQKKIDDVLAKAYDEVFYQKPVTGDYKLDADVLSDSIAEQLGKGTFTDLPQTHQTQIYNTALKRVTQDMQMKKTLKNVEEKMQLSDFDVKGRKPNASGGIAGELHLNRPGYARGSRQPGLETSTSRSKQEQQQRDIRGLQRTMADRGGGDAQAYVDVHRQMQRGDPVIRPSEKKVPVGYDPWYLPQSTRREKYLNVLRKHDPKKFHAYTKNLWDTNYVSGFTEEEESLLSPYARDNISQFYHDLYRENPEAFLNRPGKPGVAPVKDPALYTQPREYDWVAKGGRVGMGKGGLAKILGV